MEAEFARPESQLINVFNVTQIAASSFLEDLLGLDQIIIRAHAQSEVHRHVNSDNLIFVLRGSATLILNGVAHPVAPGVRVFIPRGMAHGFHVFDDDFEFISAQVPPILDKRTGRLDREVLA